MTIGEKIKTIRCFRGMTQKELGLALGFKEDNAQTRVAQYEMGYRVPKRDLTEKIAEVLNVCRYAIDAQGEETFTALIEELLWYDTENSDLICVKRAKQQNETCTKVIRRNMKRDCPVLPEDDSNLPGDVLMCFGGNKMNHFIDEWVGHKQDVQDGKITEAEYFEWKLQWTGSDVSDESVVETEESPF